MMMKKLLITLCAMVSMSILVVPSTSAITIEGCSNGAVNSSPVCRGTGQDLKDRNGGFVAQLTNILLFLVGTAAVIGIIIGGIRYAAANGEAQQIASAKNTIMYSVVGLIVALMAGAIVNFVVNSADTGTPSSTPQNTTPAPSP